MLPCPLAGRLSDDSRLLCCSAEYPFHCVGGGALLVEKDANAWIASWAVGGLERLGGGVYCGRLTWCCSGD